MTGRHRMPDAPEDDFRRGRWIYPFPVAAACARVLRSRSKAERLDAVVRAGEVLTRYLCACAIASFAAREEADTPVPEGLVKLTGNLSFGQFLAVVQGVAKTKATHPLAVHLAQGFRGRSKERPPTDEGLTHLLELRNELGHDLTSVGDVRAEQLLQTRQLEARLAGAIDGVERLLRLPLFVVEHQRVTKRKYFARRLLLMGDSPDPVPDEIELSTPVVETEQPYLATKTGLLLLKPILVWGVDAVAESNRLFVLHQATDTKLSYQMVNAARHEEGADVARELADLRAGKPVPLEDVALADGRDFVAEWSERRRELVRQADALDCRPSWEEFDAATVRWYAHQLPGTPPSGDDEARGRVRVTLLDGRDRVLPHEAEELVLLFGRPEAVRAALSRELLDLRARKSEERRWDERRELHENVVASLRQAVEFFARHVAVGGFTIEELAATTGTADYIAMREALVNLFIHQDYGDPSAAAQIEIAPERAVFFNPGKSLVSEDDLYDGGKSQSRNPLIARALRLIGYAELAGSGLRELQRAWRAARRRPPSFRSNAAANTFTLTLDWREIQYDARIRRLLGVELTDAEAFALGLTVQDPGATAEEVASATGILVEDARHIVDKLRMQGLADKHGERFRCKEHLRDRLQAQAARPRRRTR